MELPKKIEQDMKKRAITSLLTQKCDKQFVEDFRNIFSMCNGRPDESGFCSDCQVTIPTMMKVSKEEYEYAKFDEVLVCRVCGRQSQYVNETKSHSNLIMVFVIVMVVLLVILGMIILPNLNNII